VFLLRDGQKKDCELFIQMISDIWRNGRKSVIRMPQLWGIARLVFCGFLATHIPSLGL